MADDEEHGQPYVDGRLSHSRRRRRRRRRSRLVRRLVRPFFVLAFIGPSLITSSADAGGIATYSQAGAQFGYEMLWILVASTFVLAIVNEMCARSGVVTGKGLSDLIRERFGVTGAARAMALLLVANAITTTAEFAGAAAAMELFHIPKFASIPLVGLVLAWIVMRGSYEIVERVLLSIGVVYVVYVVSGVVSHPDWGVVLRSAIVPHPAYSLSYLVLAIGLIGTTISPWMLFYLQSSVAERGIPTDLLGYSRIDAVVGAIVSGIVAAFVIVAAAAALSGRGAESLFGSMQAADYARALRPVVGAGAFAIFGLLLFGASVLSAALVPLSTAYTITEAFGWERGLGQRVGEAPAFYGIFGVLVALGATATLALPTPPLITIVLLSQTANGIIVAAILLYMLILCNDRRVMGGFVNRWFANAVTGVTVVVLVALTVVLVLSLIPGSPLQVSG